MLQPAGPGFWGSTDYITALKATGPSALYRLNETTGSTFLDSSGNGNTLNISGTVIKGALPLCPATSSQPSVQFMGTNGVPLTGGSTPNPTQGLGLMASGGSTFDITTGTDFAGIASVDLTLALQFYFAKTITGATSWSFNIFSPNIQFNIGGQLCTFSINASTDVAHQRGPSMVAFTYRSGGSATNAISIWVDGNRQDYNRSQSGTFTNAGVPLMIGGRSDGYSVEGRMQNVAYYHGKTLSDATVQSLFLLHNKAERTSAIPYIYSTDSGTSDRGDFPGLAAAIQQHRIGRITLIGVMVSALDDFAGPTARVQLDYHGMQSVPVGTYQGTGTIPSNGAGGSAGLVRNHFKATGFGSVRTDYPSARVLYGQLLAAQPDDSVAVSIGGSFHCEADFLNAAPANVTLWNNKVRAVGCAAGQWPNSSSASTPAGNFLNTGNGEYNMRIGPQQCADFIAMNTAPVYWHGVEICGDVGNAPLYTASISGTTMTVTGTPNGFIKAPQFVLGSGVTANTKIVQQLTGTTGAAGTYQVSISQTVASTSMGGVVNTLPVLVAWTSPTYWDQSVNPLIYPAFVPRTAWDPIGLLALVDQLTQGDTQPYWATNRIAVPVIDLTTGHNSSVGGIANHWYFSPRLTGAQTLAQWQAERSNSVSSGLVGKNVNAYT